ncbi:hypothetical protein N431DRAFT_435416 [Stipitochalara longipes BDJ]|nr:hypothetical protein N431DRAFT_435416 [Stipitochalara longipes BDJ]
MRPSSSLFPLLGTSAKAFTLPLNCAPNNGTMTTPTYGTTGAIFTVCAQTTILSSSLPIYTTLIDFPSYPAWNTFVYAVDVPSNVSSASDVYVGMPMTFHTAGLIPLVNSTSNERITYLEPDAVPPFVGWRFDPGVLGGLVMQAEHVSLLNDLGGGKTEYVSWETYYGVGAVTVLVLRGNLQKEFEDQARDLKARVEGLKS